MKSDSFLRINFVARCTKAVFFNHDKKFELARDALPPQCFTLYDSEQDDEMWNLIINHLSIKRTQSFLHVITTGY